MPSTIYPTGAAVRAGLDAQRFRPGVVRFVRQWKRTHAGARRSPEAVAALLRGLADLYGKPVVVRVVPGAWDCYCPATRTITLNAERVSLVTALHEFAHHLHGRSELRACVWSVALFRRTFPRTFARGRFERHLFVVR